MIPKKNMGKRFKSYQFFYFLLTLLELADLFLLSHILATHVLLQVSSGD